MDYKNVLYIVAAIAIAVAAYFVIEMEVIDVDQTNQDNTEVMVNDPRAISAQNANEAMMGDEMMDESGATSSDDEMMGDEMMDESEEQVQ